MVFNPWRALNHGLANLVGFIPSFLVLWAVFRTKLEFLFKVAIQAVVGAVIRRRTDVMVHWSMAGH